MSSAFSQEPAAAAATAANSDTRRHRPRSYSLSDYHSYESSPHAESMQIQNVRNGVLSASATDDMVLVDNTRRTQYFGPNYHFELPPESYPFNYHTEPFIPGGNRLVFDSWDETWMFDDSDGYLSNRSGTVGSSFGAWDNDDMAAEILLEECKYHRPLLLFNC